MKTNLFNTRKITGMAILSALAIVLLFIPGLKFPIFPAATFLEYDACDIPIMFATFTYGPISGLIVTFIVSVIQGTTISSTSGIYGIIMHILATGSFSLSAGFLFAFLKTKKINQIASLAISTIVGSICWLVMMIFANMAITPLFMNVPFSMVMNIMLPVIIPFNLIKASVNGAIGAFLYIPLHKAVSKYLDKPIATNEDIKKAELVASCECSNKQDMEYDAQKQDNKTFSQDKDKSTSNKISKNTQDSMQDNA